MPRLTPGSLGARHAHRRHHLLAAELVYFVDCRYRRSSWQELHERTYAQTIIVLPRIADRPRPNLEHMILHSITLAGLVLAVAVATGRS